MKKNIFTILSIALSQLVFSQVGIGTTTPDASSLLDLTSTNKGFLPPRVALTSGTDAVTIPNPAKGIVAYNTNTAFASEGLYLNTGTSTAPSWKMLQLQNPGGTVIEYTSLDISPLIDLNSFPNNDGLWREAPALRQNLVVSTGTNIKTVVTAILNSLGAGSTYAQCDILVKLTPGTTPLPATLSYSTNQRDSFGAISNNGGGQSTSISVAKSTVATNTNYIIQVYLSRQNSPTNLASFNLTPAYINTLATK